MTTLLSNRKDDRRLTRRLTLKIPIRYRIGPTDASEHVSASEDVSERGIFFETDQEARVDSVVELLVEMPKQINGSSVCPWYCRGRVVRSDPISRASNRHGVGVKFDCYQVLAPPTQPFDSYRLELGDSRG